MKCPLKCVDMEQHRERREHILSGALERRLIAAGQKNIMIVQPHHGIDVGWMLRPFFMPCAKSQRDDLAQGIFGL